jgi:hypothetical protein
MRNIRLGLKNVYNEKHKTRPKRLAIANIRFGYEKGL